MTKQKVKINLKERLDENVLDLSLSEIEQIPVKDIAALRRATVIDLSSNIIRFLPKNLGTSLTHIVRLDLSRNQLKYLTDDFCNLINLKHLDLYNNQLENLPVQFGKLTKLRYLDLKGNPLQPSLQPVIGPCLTLKDCQNAAANIVPFMCDLLKKIQVEQKRKEKEDALRKEEELKELKEQIRVSKKAARKERVMRERQGKAEESGALINQEANGGIENSSADDPKSSSMSGSIVKWLEILVLVSILIFVAFNVFSPQSFDEVWSKMPVLVTEMPGKVEHFWKEYAG